MRGGRILLAVGLALATMATAVRAPAAAAAAALSLRERAAQLVMFGIAGTSLSGAERDAIQNAHLGSVILFRHNYSNRTQLENLTRQIQAAARRGNSASIGALVAVDQEGGVVKRFPDMPPWYSAPEMGARGRDLAREQGAATGRNLASAGVNVNLAPVADLDLPPEHVMRSRSFGTHPDRVGRIARAFTEGMQSKRVAATAKHFPGLGGATMNTDYGKAYVYRTRSQLRRVDAQPFRAVVNGGIKLVMLSHAMYVNDGGRRPASLHPYIAKKRLREEIGFDGVAISDALGAVAWRFGGDVPQTCAATIRAGVDLALITGGVDQARACVSAIVSSVRAGAITRRRFDNAVERVVALKRWLQV